MKIITKEITCAGGFVALEDSEVEVVAKRTEGNYDFVVLRGDYDEIKELFSDEFKDEDLFYEDQLRAARFIDAVINAAKK